MSHGTIAKTGENEMNFLDFFKGAFKIAVALFLAAIGLAIAGGIVWKAIDYSDKQAAKQYEAPKDWNVDLTKNLQLQLRAKTKLVNGQLYVSIFVDGYPAYLSESPLSIENSQGLFMLAFIDKDGFKLFEKNVPLNEMTKVLGPNGKVGGLGYQFSQYTGIGDYPNFAKLDVGWNFNVESPKAPASVAPAKTFDPDAYLAGKNKLDHCAPNLTRAERLRRLAQYGTVRETGYGEFSAGGKSIMLSEGTVISCQ
jgi:hypothetical protein